jgi:predicted HTH domain antitoxin
VKADFGTRSPSRRIDAMTTIRIEFPDEILLALKETPEGMARMIRIAAAAKLYELRKLSSGRAAEFAGISRIAFLQALADYGVAVFDLTEEELQRDLRSA